MKKILFGIAAILGLVGLAVGTNFSGARTLFAAGTESAPVVIDLAIASQQNHKTNTADSFNGSGIEWRTSNPYGPTITEAGTYKITGTATDISQYSHIGVRVSAAVGTKIHIILDNVTFDLSGIVNATSPLFIEGGSVYAGKGANVTLTLVGNNVLKSGQGNGSGIAVFAGSGNDAKLTIDGTGSLLVENGANATTAAAIGAFETGTNYQGEITINGGTIKAISNGGNCAGIGGGSPDTSANRVVTINGGHVEATGSDTGAGIGGQGQRKGSIVTINGGTVIAMGGTAGVGIGAGSAAGAARTAGDLTINGGITQIVNGASNTNTAARATPVAGSPDISMITLTIDGKDTTIAIRNGQDGANGNHGQNGTDGNHGTNGVDGNHGRDGKDATVLGGVGTGLGSVGLLLGGVALFLSLKRKKV